jgi:hypothetical protein
VDAVVGGQRRDGGWPPPGGRHSLSGVDETLWRLTQLDELALDRRHPAVEKALGFLTATQRADGAWEEDSSVASVVPPWAAPGVPAATLYLTASAGHILLLFGSREETAATRAAEYVAARTSPDGHIPSFIHSHWLAAALWWGLGQREVADRTLAYLGSRIGPNAADN